MPVTRLYQVQMKSKKKRYLVEATSREHAIRIATDPLVASVTIPTPLEAIRLQHDGVEILTKANAEAIVAPAEPAADGSRSAEGDGVGVGKLGLTATADGSETEVKGDGKGEALPPVGEQQEPPQGS